ncbi:carbohydrate ABC transporter permease [Anaerotruncus rubiinfantis]|nr:MULTISPECIES: sugar ABC transporter permease [Anaerotruncus]RGX55657.1 sugar ABC transporter permease [Anaerotruncus sp. AF02-27]
MEGYYKKWFFPLVLPAIILFVLVILIPFILGVIYSFTGWRGTYFSGGGAWYESFVGIKNYLRAFQNERFMQSLWYTFRYTVVAVVAINLTGLVFALLVNGVRRGAGAYRTVFFLPNLLGGLALGYIWQIIFNTIYTDLLFGPNGIIPVDFLAYMLQDQTKALFALAIMMVWQTAGYMMIIYVTGLNNIPGDLYEAAEIDGTTWWQQFWHVTVPMLMPSITICVFLTLANSFKLLDQNIALTDGNFGTRMLAMQILRTTKDTTPPDYGLAQAQAVIFFVMIAVITLAQVSLTKKQEVEL